MESSVSSTSALVSDVHSDKIIVHLVEGFRTVIVDDQVQFRSVIKSITERLTKQYYERERQEGSSVSDDNIYGWIFGICWNCNGRKVWIHPETSHGDFLKKFNPYSEANQKGRLELLVRYYPDDFVDVHKRHRIIFTLMYKQVLYEYLKKESVPLELAIKLACLEIRRKYPQLNHKAAKLIANAIEDETFKTLFPEKVLLQVRLRDLRRQVVKSFQQMDEKASSDAVIEFLNLVKKHLFFFEREFYDVRLHESFPIATTLMVGPGACQISSGARISSGRESLTLLARFEHVLRIEPISEPQLHVLLLYVEASSEPLYINCASEDELENLADLIDGYVRGSRTVPDGSVIVANGANARQLPDIPAPSFESLSNIPANYAAQPTVTNQMRFVPKTIESDDDYATIVDPIEEKIDPSFELDRSKIDLLREIGQGQFGNVHCANYKNDGITALVAVKKTNFEEDSEELKQKFIEEAQIMCHFNHKHIVQLIGVCTKGWPILIVMEYCALGCIRDYLIQNAEALDIHHLLEYIYQLSSALKYLEEQNFVHRDIAARNLMLTNEHTVKLGDFGLSRQVKETDAYYVATTGKLPIKWMAPESINYRKFTSQSDVWMFAVCSWEILSCGVKPFQGVKNNDVILQIENGIRLECPKKCPLSLFKIMKQCWKYQAHLRPTAAQNHEQIGYLLDSFNQEDSANVYSVNSELRTKTEITGMPDDLFNSLQRNPLLPPKALPKEVREHTARQKLEEKIKRDSTIMTKISDQSSEASENQKWAEEKMLQSQESLNRTGSLGSRSSQSRSESSSSNLANSANAKVAPPKPPRTAKVSNSSSDAAAVHNPYAHETLKDESSLFPAPPKSSTNDAEKVDSDSSSSTRSSKKSLAPPAPAPIKPLLEEMPKLNLKDVVLDKTRALNRENDTIWAATLDVVKELVTLRNSAETARPESLINQIKSIGLKCKKLDGEVTSFCEQLEDAERREIELEKRSVYAEMKQVISQITNVRNFDGTKTASEYRNVLMASILVMSIAVKNLQDVIDKARQVLST